MKPKIYLFTLFLTGILYAQENESIQTDRPDQTETPALTPLKMLQVETGFSAKKTNNDASSFVLPSVLWKYGISDNFELRLITEFANNKSYSTRTSGMNPVLIGFKAKIIEENGIIPQTSIIGHLALPNVSSTKFKLDYLAPQFRFAIQHTLTEKIALSYNLGSEWDGFTAEPSFIYSLATGYSITEKVETYVEIFGFAPQNQKSNHNFDGGFTYLVSNNAMIDVSGGIGLTENAPKYYFALGFSFRI
ncbi:transporter [uncultured Flavobacterium sp.]|uniref:transporter n=1 Tax=uncultured Flavobacterium sp. TaxID=165435 RepID=UPI0030EBBA2B